jgi:hypothetical protein
MPLPGIFASSYRSAAGPQGAYDALASVTLSATASSIVFAGIPSGYKHLQIRGIVKLSSINSILMRFNGDSTTNYSRHGLYGDGTSPGSFNSASVSAVGISQALGISASTNIYSGLIVDILDYASITKNKTVRILSGYDANGSGAIELDSSAWYSTSAITSMTLVGQSGETFSANSSFALYGVK